MKNEWETANATANGKAISSESSRHVRQPAKNPCFIEEHDLKAEYDFSTMKARKNPYAAKLKIPVTMRLSEDVVLHFKQMATEAGIPYQSLINLYLRGCLAKNRRVDIRWAITA